MHKFAGRMELPYLLQESGARSQNTEVRRKKTEERWGEINIPIAGKVIAEWNNLPMEPRERETLNREIGEEGAILDLLSTSMSRAGFYSPEDAESLAFRMAEILVFSKNLYTDVMPRLMEIDSENKDQIVEFLTEVRMNFQFIHDCIEEFDENFFNLMQGEDENDDGEDEETNDDGQL